MIEYDPFSLDVKEDPEKYFTELRRSCPVHHHVLKGVDLDRISRNPLVARPTNEFWSVFRYEDIRQAALDPETFSSKEGPVPERIMPMNEDGMLLYADPPALTRQRRILTKALSPRAVEELRSSVQEIADELVDNLAAAGAADVVADFAVPLSIRVLAALVGVDEDRTDDLWRWGNDTNAAFGGDVEATERGFSSMMELFDYLRPKIEERRALMARGEDLPPGLLSALVATDWEGETFTDTEVLMAAQQLLVAGFETTSTGTASAVHLLCTHPDQRQLFEEGAVPIEHLVEETLRFAPPIMGLFRNTTRDVEIAGCPIPAGSKVELLWASANHDERIFTDPNSFRIDRDPAETRRHLGFGFGPHSCPGSALARVEMAVGISTLFHRLPGLDLDQSQKALRNRMILINGFTSLPIRWDPALATGGPS